MVFVLPQRPTFGIQQGLDRALCPRAGRDTCVGLLLREPFAVLHLPTNLQAPLVVARIAACAGMRPSPGCWERAGRLWLSVF